MGPEDRDATDVPIAVQLWVSLSLRRASGIHRLLTACRIRIRIRRYYGVMVPTLLNLATLAGYCILNSIVSGQALSSVSNDHLSWR